MVWEQRIDTPKEKMSAVLNEINSARQSLMDLKEDAENFQAGCHIVKTAGTTSSVVGAGFTIAGTVGAFFTGGASLLVAGALGSIFTASGVGVNLTTDMIDKMGTAEYIRIIEHKVSSLQRSCKELDELIDTMKRKRLASDLTEAFSMSIKMNKLNTEMNRVEYGKCNVAVELYGIVNDIVSLVKDWNSTHPAVKVINDVLDKINLLEKKLQEIRPHLL